MAVTETTNAAIHTPDYPEMFIDHGRYLRAWSPRTVETYRRAFRALAASGISANTCGSSSCQIHISTYADQWALSAPTFTRTHSATASPQRMCATEATTT
jgi:hypothetical protein